MSRWLIGLLPLLASALAAEETTQATWPERVARYGCFEWRVLSPEPVRAALARGDNPYRPDQLRLDAWLQLPNGEEVQVPGYYHVPCERRLDPLPPAEDEDPPATGADATHLDRLRFTEVVTPTDAGDWRVRFLPTLPGDHSFIVRLLVADLLVGEWTGRFTVTEETDADTAWAPDRPLAASEGMVRRDPERSVGFRLDSGRRYYALGHNVGWPDQHGDATTGAAGMEYYFDRMAAAGENHARVWLCTWGIRLDGRTPYTIDPAGAWRLEETLRLAAERGIYVKLCLDNFFDFRNHWDQSPFNAENGGPYRTRAGFFEVTDNPLSAAFLQCNARLRYLSARYGAFPSLFAWELWNEMDLAYTNADRRSFFPEQYVPPASDNVNLGEALELLFPIRNDMVAWTRKAASELKQLDPHRHLVTTSLSSQQFWPELWALDEIDVAQYHRYLRHHDGFGLTDDQDEVAVVAEAAELLRSTGKPGLLAEFGFAGEGDRSSMSRVDAEGWTLKFSLWAGLMTNLAGTPMAWWWESYIDEQRLYGRYAALARFAADLDRARAWTPGGPADDGRAEARWLASDGETRLWLRRSGEHWFARLGRLGPPPNLQDVAVVLPGHAGRWRVEWFDTEAGEYVGEVAEEEADAEGRLTVYPPPFAVDLAARLRRVPE